MGVVGRDGPSNKNRLCVKGRYGFDYTHSKKRLTTPMKRKKGVAKDVSNLSKNIDEIFEPISWDQALDESAVGFLDIINNNGNDFLAGFGSAKCSNEEAYLFQKLIRTGFVNNNVDHCTRLCHASSVYALLEGIGSGAVSNTFNDAENADTIVIIGANPSINHPVASSFFKNAAKNGKSIIEINPIKTRMSRFAQYFLQTNSGTDVVLLNSIMYVIISENLIDKNYIDKHTEGFDDLKQTVMQYRPEKVSAICGIDADTIKNVARLYAKAKNSIIFWGMGISQHMHGTNNARCLIALALMTGHIGRVGTGLHPLRGQNNVQGASDAGLIPMMYPDYQSVTNNDIRKNFEKKWGVSLNSNAGKTVVEIIHSIGKGDILGMYVMGENPAMSDPNLNSARKSLSKLKHLVVQDIFYTETAAFADIILPATSFMEKTGTFTNTNRQVQLGRQAINPPGQAKQDWLIIKEIANRLSLNWKYEKIQDVFDEMRNIMPSIGGITWQRLQEESSVIYPCRNEGDKGEEVIFVNGFPTENGKAKFVAADYQESRELPSKNYPFVLITGRVLEHWHTGTMTRKSEILNNLKPSSFININSYDVKKFNFNITKPIKIKSIRGSVIADIKIDDGLQKGSVFMPFCFTESAANILTREDIDPKGKIPSFKYCAVALEQ